MSAYDQLPDPKDQLPDPTDITQAEQQRNQSPAMDQTIQNLSQPEQSTQPQSNDVQEITAGMEDYGCSPYWSEDTSANWDQGGDTGSQGGTDVKPPQDGGGNEKGGSLIDNVLGFWKGMDSTSKNITASMIYGIFSAKNRQAESDAKVKMAEASMINAKSNADVNAHTMALKDKQMANASGIINATNYGKSGAIPVFKDKLAVRRDRSGA